MPGPVITVFGASKPVPGDRLYEQGVTCGLLLAEAGYGVATGGYQGLMEAVSRGAREGGGLVVGVTAPDVFQNRSNANEFVTEERKTAHLTERIHELTRLSAAALVLPGSLGTLTELTVAWNLAFVARFSNGESKPIITVGDDWTEIVDYLATRLDTDRALVTTVVTVEEAVTQIKERVPIHRS